MESLNSATANKSLLVIAHRLSTIQDADRIIVIDNGIAAEEGNHQELLEMNGLYKLMWDTQTKTTETPKRVDQAAMVSPAVKQLLVKT